MSIDFLASFVKDDLENLFEIPTQDIAGNGANTLKII